MSYVNSFISTTSIRSKISNDLKIILRPNWSWSALKPYFCELSRLPSSVRLDESCFALVFYCLLFVRVDTSDAEMSRRIENLLRAVQIPKGFQDLVRYLPLGGTIHQYKTFQIRFILDEKLVTSLRDKLESGDLAFTINELSRHLNSVKDSSSESFNPSLLTCINKHFNLCSFFCVNVYQSNEKTPNFVLNLSSRSPDLTVGSALAVIFGFTDDTNSDLEKMIGVVAEAELSYHDLNATTRSAFIFILSVRNKGPRSGSETSNHVGAGPSDMPDNKPGSGKSDPKSTQSLFPKSESKHQFIVRAKPSSPDVKSIPIYLDVILKVQDLLPDNARSLGVTG